jgi:soluble P-type ATPase
MIDIDIPGFKALRLEHLVLDFNGTIAVDGELLPGVAQQLNRLASELTVHVVTADTFGKAAAQLEGVSCSLSVLPADEQDIAKLAYVNELGAEGTVCVGNGRNDRLMLAASALGIAVVLAEGASSLSLTAADVVCKDILSALDLLTHPLRLTATLRA